MSYSITFSKGVSKALEKINEPYYREKVNIVFARIFFNTEGAE